MNKSVRIAFYGKGGIGKSTIASNMAAAFSSLGLKVLFIGCDPKGDSTRNLVGKRIPTVIQSIQDKGENIKESDFMKIGFNGIHCIETGGPEAGVGCAGRGIISMMEELENHKILDRNWDVLIFDVLGDVVCGGFSVPMRDQYVDAVYIVTSSEFMSIYAANNIMKSIARFSEDQKPFFGGLIYNHRNNNLYENTLNAFSQKTNTNIIAEIPYSDEIVFSELLAKTVTERKKCNAIIDIFTNLAKKIINERNYGIPNPLNDEDLELLSLQIMEMKLKERDYYVE